jgi:hypothetical protein
MLGSLGDGESTSGKSKNFALAAAKTTNGCSHKASSLDKLPKGSRHYSQCFSKAILVSSEVIYGMTRDIKGHHQWGLRKAVAYRLVQHIYKIVVNQGLSKFQDGSGRYVSQVSYYLRIVHHETARGTACEWNGGVRLLAAHTGPQLFDLVGPMYLNCSRAIGDETRRFSDEPAGMSGHAQAIRIIP